jgi:DNA-binding GntR family transcriptional regulator
MTRDNATPSRIPRATFASMVTERLRDSIVNGTVQPGSQLSEVELANSFGVSRGPVREALQRLIQEGLLRSEPHRGVFVPVLTNEDIIDIYLAREALECAAVRHVSATSQMATAYRALDKHVKAMEKAEAAEDWEAIGRLDLEFHTALVAATESQRLQRMFSTVISETQLCLGVLTGAEARHDLVIEHRRICDWVRVGDTEQAVHALKQHFEAAVVTLTNDLARDADDASVADGR